MLEFERKNKLRIINEKCNNEEKARKIGNAFNRKLKDEKYLTELTYRMLSNNEDITSDFLPLIKEKYIFTSNNELLDYLSLFDVKTGRKIIYYTMIKNNDLELNPNDIYFFCTKQAAFSTGAIIWIDKFDINPGEIDAVYYFRSLDNGKVYEIKGIEECNKFIDTHKTLILSDNKGKNNQYFKIYQRLYFKLLISNNLNTNNAYTLLNEIVSTSNKANVKRRKLGK